MRTSTLERDLSYTPHGDGGELERPSAWTADWVKHRMVEAFTIERRIPDKRVGPAIVKGAWAKIATTDSFADRVHQGELAREHVWDKWARSGGALPYEVSWHGRGAILAGDGSGERPRCRGQGGAGLGVLRAPSKLAHGLAREPFCKTKTFLFQ